MMHLYTCFGLLMHFDGTGPSYCGAEATVAPRHDGIDFMPTSYREQEAGVYQIGTGMASSGQRRKARRQLLPEIWPELPQQKREEVVGIWSALGR